MGLRLSNTHLKPIAPCPLMMIPAPCVLPLQVSNIHTQAQPLFFQPLLLLWPWLGKARCQVAWVMIRGLQPPRLTAWQLGAQAPQLLRWVLHHSTSCGHSSNPVVLPGTWVWPSKQREHGLLGDAAVGIMHMHPVAPSYQWAPSFVALTNLHGPGAWSWEPIGRKVCRHYVHSHPVRVMCSPLHECASRAAQFSCCR